MMQIVLNTLQTDSGDQPGSSCLSQKQKMKGDVRRWVGARPQLWALGGRGRPPEHPAPRLPNAPAPRLPPPGPGLAPPLGAAWHIHRPLQPGLAGGPGTRSLPSLPSPLRDASAPNEGCGHQVRISRTSVLTRIWVWETRAKLLHKPLETRKQRNPIGSERRELSFLRADNDSLPQLQGKIPMF